MLLKCAFHVHSGEDPEDKLSYSAEQLLRYAKKRGFDVLALTCHTKLVWSEPLAQLAKKLGILLIPALEAELERCHILVLNATREVEKFHTLKELRAWKKQHPECFIIAPHPYFKLHSLGKKLDRNLSLFDAVELSFFYTKSFDLNRRAAKLTETHHLPLLATSDCHFLEYLDLGYCTIETPRKTPQAVFTALRKHHFTNHTKPLTALQMCKIYAKMILK